MVEKLVEIAEQLAALSIRLQALGAESASFQLSTVATDLVNLSLHRAREAALEVVLEPEPALEPGPD